MEGEEQFGNKGVDHNGCVEGKVYNLVEGLLRRLLVGVGCSLQFRSLSIEWFFLFLLSLVEVC